MQQRLAKTYKLSWTTKIRDWYDLSLCCIAHTQPGVGGPDPGDVPLVSRPPLHVVVAAHDHQATGAHGVEVALRKNKCKHFLLQSHEHLPQKRAFSPHSVHGSCSFKDVSTKASAIPRKAFLSFSATAKTVAKCSTDNQLRLNISHCFCHPTYSIEYLSFKKEFKKQAFLQDRSYLVFFLHFFDIETATLTLTGNSILPTRTKKTGVIHSFLSLLLSPTFLQKRCWHASLH